MPLNEATKSKLIAFIEQFNENIGKRLSLLESISTHKDNFDRHFTSSSSFELTLTHVAVKFSGARLTLYGERASYEIGLGFIIRFEESENEIVFLEAYYEHIYRRTALKILD